MPVSTFSADGRITSQSVPVTTNTSEPFDYLGSTVTKFTEEEAEAALVGEPINPIARIVFLVAALTIAIVGVVGSGSLLYMIHKHWKNSNHNVFIASLALADLLILGYWWPFFCVDLIVDFHPVANQKHCQINAVISVALSLVYVTSLIMVTLNRFMLVCHSRRYEQCFSPKTTVLGVIALWVGSIASAIIPVYGTTVVYRYDAITRTCTFKKLGQGYLDSLLTMLYFAVPLCLIGFFNFRIYRFWNRANVKLAQRGSIIDPPSTDCPTRKGSISLQEKGTQQTDSASKLSRIDEKSFALSFEDNSTVQTPECTCCEPSSTCRCHSSSPTNKFTIPAAAVTFLYDSPSGKTTRRSVSSVGSSYQPRQTELTPAFTIESSVDASTPRTPVPRAVTRKPGPSRCRTPSPLSRSYCTKLRRLSPSAITSASDPGKNSTSTDGRTEITKTTERSSAESESESVKTFFIPVISMEEPRPLPNVLPFLALTQERDDVSIKSRADTEDTDRASSIVSSTINPRAKSLWLPADTGAQSGCSSATALRKGSVKTFDIEESGSASFKKKKKDSKAPKKSSLAKGNKNKNAYVNMDFFRDDPSNLGGSLSSDVHIHPTYPRPFSMMMLHYQAPETSTQSEGTDPHQSQTTPYQEITIDTPNDHISITQNSQKMRILDSDADSSMCGKKCQPISTAFLTRFTSAILIPTRTSLQFLAVKRRFLSSGDSGQQKCSMMEQRIAAMAKRIEKREKAVVRSLLAVSLLAAIAFIPYGAVRLVAEFVDLPPELYISVNLFFCLNAALNWVVYGVMNPTFRDSYCHMFHRLFHVCADKEKFLHTPGPKVSVHSSLSPEHDRDIFNTPSLSASGFRSRSSVNIGIRGLGASAGALTFPAGEVSLLKSRVDCDNCGYCRASPSVGTQV
ncbi:uncharacterized protein [Littorina saxatilis]|uniref:G-protein coupled receptors family 1 profile domain-containing protein n=1 Tax=Littorina saxatilis TaxID=31220 RepID=A0AAN9B975_9CAEN